MCPTPAFLHRIMELTQQLQQAKLAAPSLAALSTQTKNEALRAMANALVAHAPAILAANEQDIALWQAKLGEVMVDRLRLTEQRIADMAQGIREVADLPDPMGKVLEQVERPNGLHIERVQVPFGVVAIVYESRPNVTSDAAALCFKSGNVCVLKCGKECYATSLAIVDALHEALRACGLDTRYINIPAACSRETTQQLMTAVGLVDLLIPRGGAGLIRSCVENAKVPCIQTGTGICHVYVDDSADQDMALRIIVNAKTQRPSVCNAEEVCLVHEAIAAEFLPKLKKALVDDRASAGQKPVELRLCPQAARIIEGKAAGENDFDTEFLDYILAVKVVKNVEEAVAHIGAHSTHHSDAIVTQTQQNADLFVLGVDSSAVYVNASTRFTDGGVFGKGCEIGISTQKLHARGPMGLDELMTYKYVIKGGGQTR